MVHLDNIDDRRLAAPATLSFMAGNSLRTSWACYVWGMSKTGEPIRHRGSELGTYAGTAARPLLASQLRP